MIQVVYSKNGESISDFKVNEYVDNIIKIHNSDSDLVVKTTSELCLLVFGLRVFEERLSIDEVEFYFEDRRLEFHPYLGICDPDDCDFGFYHQVCDRAVILGYKKMMKDKFNGYKSDV